MTLPVTPAGAFTAIVLMALVTYLTRVGACW